MHEDRLSPPLGRLIDAVRTALADVPGEGTPLEAVALLMDDGTILAKASAVDPETGCCAAAESVLEICGKSTFGGIDAAAVAVGTGADNVVPCARCRAALERVDADLPLVVKQLGRWVLLPLSSVDEQR